MNISSPSGAIATANGSSNVAVVASPPSPTPPPASVVMIAPRAGPGPTRPERGVAAVDRCHIVRADPQARRGPRGRTGRQPRRGKRAADPSTKLTVPPVGTVPLGGLVVTVAVKTSVWPYVNVEAERPSVVTVPIESKLRSSSPATIAMNRLLDPALRRRFLAGRSGVTTLGPRQAEIARIA